VQRHFSVLPHPTDAPGSWGYLSEQTHGVIGLHMKVCICVVGKTQVYLGDVEFQLLDRVAADTGETRSALIRRAIRNTFGEHSIAERLLARDRSAGSWIR
jgi:hypothetical protein